jgi:hypothetical protein
MFAGSAGATSNDGLSGRIPYLLHITTAEFDRRMQE